MSHVSASMVKVTHPQRFTRQQRLIKPGDYRRVYSSRFWGHTELFSFNLQPADTARLGVTVSRKVSKSAVIRNQLRRQIKEFYRLHQNELQALELIITAKPAAAQASRQQCVTQLQALLTKIHGWQSWYQKSNALNRQT